MRSLIILLLFTLSCDNPDPVYAVDNPIRDISCPEVTDTITIIQRDTVETIKEVIIEVKDNTYYELSQTLAKEVNELEEKLFQAESLVEALKPHLVEDYKKLFDHE